MSYQLLEQDEPWEEDQDKALLALPILGCIFKKSYYDPVKAHNVSKLVLPQDLVVHYYARSVEDCERKTEVFQLYPREVRERELRGTFRENEYGPGGIDDPRNEDKRQGLTAPPDDEDRPRTFLEQHCYLDLDGDGYKEPYVVTIDEKSKKVARIVARFETITTEQSLKIKELQSRMKALAEGLPQPQQGQEPTPQMMMQIQQAEQTLMAMQEEIKALSEEKPKVLSIKPVEHYTKYPFIPSPDGGFYDLGFGALLGPLNDSVNTLINQLIDSGTLNNSNTGFIGKGARIKGGAVRFQPNELKRVNVAGGTLRDSIVMMDFKPPSPVLFQLLGMLVNYAERVASVNDAMMGENPGQNTPAFTSKQMLEQGLQVFNGIFKRIYRSFRSELRKLYALNAIYLDKEEYFSYQDSDSKVLATDYTSDPKDLIPAADPNAFANTERMAKAQSVAERAMSVPGYDPIKVEQRLHEAMDIPDASEIYPLVPEMDEQGQETGGMALRFPPQPDPELEIEKADMQRRVLEGQSKAEAQMMKAESDVMVNEAKVLLMMAQAQVAADSPELERLKLLLKSFDDQRKFMAEKMKIAAAENKKETDG
jgi:chaperonin GroES